MKVLREELEEYNYSEEDINILMCHPYEPWFNQDRWYIYLKTVDNDNIPIYHRSYDANRRLIKRKNKKDLYDEIIKNYKLTDKKITENIKYPLQINNNNIKDSNQTNQYVYFISNGRYVKIGVTENIPKRLKTLQVGNSDALRLLFSIESKEAYNIETMLHTLFAPYLIRGEWYNILFLFK